MALLKRWRTGVKARIESGKLPFKSSGTKFFNCFDSSACATNINLACHSKNLLLATSSEQGESIHGLLQMFQHHDFRNTAGARHSVLRFHTRRPDEQGVAPFPSRDSPPLQANLHKHSRCEMARRPPAAW